MPNSVITALMNPKLCGFEFRQGFDSIILFKPIDSENWQGLRYEDLPQIRSNLNNVGLSQLSDRFIKMAIAAVVLHQNPNSNFQLLTDRNDHEQHH